jgi:hypothetical protein
VGALWLHTGDIPRIAATASANLHHDVSMLGLLGIFLIFARAYSRGAGTYTGIEAVSNGLQMMREPRVPTAKRTMGYMAVSLAVTAGSIFLLYLLLGVVEEPGKTLNAVMVERLNFGPWFVVLTLVSEAALLFVAAQTGFLDGPRVMANMANDRWLPNRFASLSDRLTMHYGILLMGAASLMLLFYTQGHIDILVTMYSINVFVTFSLSQLGMIRFWVDERSKHREWKRAILIHVIGLILCLGILVLVVIEKFRDGAWLTIVITSMLILLCFIIKNHYRIVKNKLRSLEDVLTGIPIDENPGVPVGKIDPSKTTAILLVQSYSGLGIHSLLSIVKQFPGYFNQLVFVSVAVLDSGNFKGAAEVEGMEEKVQADLAQYVKLANSLGFPATSRMSTGTEAVVEAEKICLELSKEFKQSIFFSAKLVFQKEKWYQRILHSETANAIQNRLQFLGLSMVILPIRVWN